MEKVRLLLVIDPLLPVIDQVNAGIQLNRIPNIEIGLLHLVDPGDISPAYPYYDDVMDEMRQQGFRYLSNFVRMMNISECETFLRISRHADRIIAAVARGFQASYIVMGTTPGWQRPFMSLDEFIAQVGILTTIPVLKLHEEKLTKERYQLHYN